MLFIVATPRLLYVILENGISKSANLNDRVSYHKMISASNLSFNLMFAWILPITCYFTRDTLCMHTTAFQMFSTTTTTVYFHTISAGKTKIHLCYHKEHIIVV